MSDYSPPVRDVKFVLDHICDINEIVSYPAFEHVDPELAFGALDEAARFFSEVVAPTNRDGDTIGSIRNDDGTVTAPPSFKKAYDQYIAAGWGAVKGPMEYGGHGFPGSVGLAILEMMTSANMAFSLCPMLSSSAILAIEAHGSDEQKATYLEKLVSGHWTGTMVLTEPEAGSDVGALRAKATPNDDGSWAISGTKIFITWGEHDMAENIVHLVLARTPGAPPGTKGISLFVVPKLLPDESGAAGDTNRVSCVSIEHKLGIHGSPTCVMAFEDSTGWLIGEENQGMRAMFTMMNDARLHVGLEGMGVAERSYQQALEYATTRTQGRAVGAPKTTVSPIIEHPDVRRMLMTMKAYIEGARALLYDIAASIDREHHAPDEAARLAGQERAALLTPVGKAFGTDLGVELTSIGVQIHGGPGYIEETGSAQFFRDARIAPIYEGTNGIQAIDLVMRKLPMRAGGAVDDFLGEIERSESSLRSADLGAIADRLATARGQVAEATAYLLACENPNDALAGAAPYCRMFGLVASSHYLARQALVATATADEDDWMAAKVATARFYATQLLPQVGGLLPSVTAGADQLFEIDLPAVSA
jgi:acyl-CoA dehydrogenase